MWFAALVVTGLLVSTPHGSVPDDPVKRCDAGCRALVALHRWDHERAAAFVTADPGALRRLYDAGSRAGVRDVALLRAYDDAGVAITSMATQTFSARLRAHDKRRTVLEVVDRVIGTGADDVRCLPLVTRPHRHRVELLYRGGRWLVGTVR